MAESREGVKSQRLSFGGRPDISCRRGNSITRMFGIPVDRLLQWTTALYLLSLALMTLCGVAFWRLSVVAANDREDRLAEVREAAALRIDLVQDEEKRMRENLSRQVADAEARARAAEEAAHISSEQAREIAAQAAAAIADGRAANDKAASTMIRDTPTEERARVPEQQPSGVREKNQVVPSAAPTSQMVVRDASLKFGPRHLTDADSRLLKVSLYRVRGDIPEVSITRFSDMEAFLYANEVMVAFVEAGVRVVVNTIGERSPPLHGVVVYEDRTSGVISSALAAAGVQAQVEPLGARSVPQIVVGLQPPPW